MLADLSLPDVAGLAGALLVCAAYFLVSRRALDPEGLHFQLMNLAGAALLLVSLWFRPNLGAILIEIIWAAIALLALVRLVRQRRR
jgi:hypothetical protein